MVEFLSFIFFAFSFLLLIFFPLLHSIDEIEYFPTKTAPLEFTWLLQYFDAARIYGRARIIVPLAQIAQDTREFMGSAFLDGLHFLTQIGVIYYHSMGVVIVNPMAVQYVRDVIVRADPLKPRNLMELPYALGSVQFQHDMVDLRKCLVWPRVVPSLMRERAEELKLMLL